MTKVFISYAHTDESYRKELEKHLSVLKRNGYIDTWTDRQIIAGENWGNQIAKELEEAKVILLLISSDFLASDYCYDIEMKKAVERHNNKEAIVVPIILRYCDWSNTPFSVIQGLPLNTKPVKDWSDQDQAFLNIVEGIKALLNSLNNSNRDTTLSFAIAISPESKLSEIRKNILVAESEKELRMAKFNLEEYKKQHPFTFEVEDLELMLKKAMSYKWHEMLLPEIKMGDLHSPAYDRKIMFRWIKVLAILIFISLVIYLLVRTLK